MPARAQAPDCRTQNTVCPALPAAAFIVLCALLALLALAGCSAKGAVVRTTEAGSSSEANAAPPAVQPSASADVGAGSSTADDPGASVDDSKLPTPAAGDTFTYTLVGATAWPVADGKRLSGERAATVSAEKKGRLKLAQGSVSEWVDPSDVLVNLPDLEPDIAYDVVYSYSSPSHAGEAEIPGLTGERLDGYRKGKSWNGRLGKDEYVVPVQYDVAVILSKAQRKFAKHGYNLLIWDAYRPHKASEHIYRTFMEAYENDADVRRAVSNWGVGWFASSYISAHNYGVAVDMTLADAETGKPVKMPSGFDAFDESATLTDEPISQAEITPDAYRAAVRSSKPCMLMHKVFRKLGMSELASEWWHFQSAQALSHVRGLRDGEPLDFKANLPDS